MKPLKIYLIGMMVVLLFAAPAFAQSLFPGWEQYTNESDYLNALKGAGDGHESHELLGEQWISFQSSSPDYASARIEDLRAPEILAEGGVIDTGIPIIASGSNASLEVWDDSKMHLDVHFSSGERIDNIKNIPFLDGDAHDDGDPVRCRVGVYFKIPHAGNWASFSNVSLNGTTAPGDIVLPSEIAGIDKFIGWVKETNEDVIFEFDQVLPLGSTRATAGMHLAGVPELPPGALAFMIPMLSFGWSWIRRRH